MTTPKPYTKLRIFAASPSDVASERAKLSTVVENLKPLADNLGLALEVIDWRAVVPDAGRPQQVIFDQLKPTTWDVFVGILWHRFGTPPGASNVQTGKEYLSGTEEEFTTAYKLWQQHKRPRIMLYRCTRQLPYDVDPDQLKRVRDFFKLIEDVKGDYPTLYQAFDTTEAFEKLLLDNLQKLLLEYGDAHGRGAVTAPVLAPKIPDNLPRRAPFFGRTKEIAEVMRALSPDDRGWGVIVDGIGGIGKTALAVECAHRAREGGLFDAFSFVSAKTTRLEPSGIREQSPAARARDEFINETARVLGQIGIAQLAGDGKRHALLDALRGTRALLIWDNLETLDNESQLALADLLRELPLGSKAIVTSRRRGGEGAVWLRLERLEWDAARDLIQSEMGRSTALAQKLQRAGEARWRELYDETGGSPLALTFVLGMLRARDLFTMDDALQMLRRRGEVSSPVSPPDMGAETAPLHEFIFQEARKELDASDIAALGALSFFVPSASFEALQEVSGLSRTALQTVIERLSARSLVNIEADGERFSLHPLTQNFVQSELHTDSREIAMRFANYWLAYAKRYGGADKESYKTYDRLEVEWANLDATANWLWETANVQGGSIGDKNAARMLSSLASELSQYLDLIGRWDEGLQLLEQAHELAHALSNLGAAGLHANQLAQIYQRRGLAENASVWRTRHLEEWKQAGDIFATIVDLGIYRDISPVILLSENSDAATLATKPSVVWNDNDIESVIRHIIEYEDQDKFGQAKLIGAFSGGILFLGQWAQARKLYEQELALAKEVGSAELIAQAQYGLARVHEAEGRSDHALPLAQEALKIYERLQHQDAAEVRALVERLKRMLATDAKRINE